jgi:hypothetical protein
MRPLTLRSWEKKLIRALAIISSVYLGLVFIGIIPVHCDGVRQEPIAAQTETSPTQSLDANGNIPSDVAAQTAAPLTQAEMFASSSKATQQVMCNILIVITGTTGQILVLIIPICLLARSGIIIIKKLKRRARKSG